MEREQLKLDVPNGVAPRTDTGAWGVVMAHASGKNDTVQWFEFKPGFYAASVRVEWPLGSMLTVVDSNIAEMLINGGYARVMTQEEALDYNTEPGDTSEKVQSGEPDEGPDVLGEDGKPKRKRRG